jgi:hypothetical protein
MMSPVMGSIVIKVIGSQSLLEVLVCCAKAALKGPERQIRNAGLRDVSLRLRKPIFLRALEVFLRRVVDQADDSALSINGD